MFSLLEEDGVVRVIGCFLVFGNYRVVGVWGWGGVEEGLDVGRYFCFYKFCG